MKQFSLFGIAASCLSLAGIAGYSAQSLAAEWKITGQDNSATVSQVTPDTTQASPAPAQPSSAASSSAVVSNNEEMPGTVVDPLPAQTTNGWRFGNTELTVSVWESDGGTSWNHTAKPLNSNFGDPTSRLDYRDISGTVIDLGVEIPINNGFYADFHYAHSSVDDGILIDDDYLSSQGAAALGIASSGDLLVSRTASRVDEGTIQAFSATLGREVQRFSDTRLDLRFYGKYQDYSESYHASGVRQLVCEAPYWFCAPEGSQEFMGQRVISNKANWKSVFVGVDGTFNFTPRLSISGDFAWSPWARVTNNDVHLLRGDLRNDPSIQIRTTGKGLNASAELAYRIGHWRASLGYQYWKLQSKGDPNAISFFPASEGGASVDANLNEIVTKREGWRLALSYIFGDEPKPY